MARAVVQRSALAAGATVLYVMVRLVEEARRIVVALQVVVALWVIVRRDASRVLQSGTRTRDVDGRARTRGLEGHDPLVLFVAIRTVLGAAHRPLSDETSSVVEAKTLEIDVGLWDAANERSGIESCPPSKDRLYPEAGVGIQRLNWPMILNAKSLMLRLKVTLKS